MLATFAQVSATDIGIWLGCACAVIWGVRGALSLIVTWRQLTWQHAPYAMATVAQLNDLRSEMRTELSGMKSEIAGIREHMADHNQQDADSFQELKVEITKIATLIQERLPAPRGNRPRAC